MNRHEAIRIIEPLIPNWETLADDLLLKELEWLEEVLPLFAFDAVTLARFAEAISVLRPFLYMRLQQIDTETFDF